MEDSIKQLLELKRLTQLTGEVSNMQAIQLKYWPQIAAPHGKDFEAKVDSTLKKVEFSWKKSARIANKKTFELSLDSLCESTQWLLGVDWAVIVYQDRQILRNVKGKRPEQDPIVKAVAAYAAETGGATERKGEKTI